MKVLLVNPKPSGMRFQSAGRSSIPIGLAYIGSYLKERGIKVQIKDYWVEGPSVSWKDFDVIGLSVMSTQVPHALEITKQIKGTDKKIKVAWGGVHPTLLPEQTFVSGIIDAVVVGEGEKAMLDITEGKEGIIQSKFLKIEEIPELDYSLFQKSVLGNMELAPYSTSRGCPHRCTFCINPITKCMWRGLPAERVVEELKNVRKTFPNKPVRFWDENAFVNPARIEGIIEGIIEENINIRWETTCRCDYMSRFSKEFWTKAKRSGLYKLSFGAESGSKRILEYIKKDITPEDIENANIACRDLGISPEFSFMCAEPQETDEDLNMTLQLIDRMHKANPDVELIGPQPYRPYPGSPLYNECLASGWREPNSLEDWAKYMDNEWNYLDIHRFPWVKNPDKIEALWAFLNYALTSDKKLLQSGIRASDILKRLFILASKARWRLKFFDFPIEYKIGRMVMK